jgi:hypothetical protein
MEILPQQPTVNHEEQALAEKQIQQPPVNNLSLIYNPVQQDFIPVQGEIDEATQLQVVNDINQGLIPLTLPEVTPGVAGLITDKEHVLGIVDHTNNLQQFETPIPFTTPQPQPEETTEIPPITSQTTEIPPQEVPIMNKITEFLPHKIYQKSEANVPSIFIAPTESNSVDTSLETAPETTELESVASQTEPVITESPIKTQTTESEAVPSQAEPEVTESETTESDSFPNVISVASQAEPEVTESSIETQTTESPIESKTTKAESPISVKTQTKPEVTESETTESESFPNDISVASDTNTDTDGITGSTNQPTMLVPEAVPVLFPDESINEELKKAPIVDDSDSRLHHE